MVEDRYDILTSKRRSNTYRANRRIFHLNSQQGANMDIVFQVSNDGVAFRYLFPDSKTEAVSITAEATSFHFLPETRAWLQPMQKAKTGFAKTNPAYEEFYQKEIPAGTPSALGHGWVYPSLFRSGETWLLLSEVALPAGWCATHLGHESPSGEYSIAFPDQLQTMNGEPVIPSAKMPWASPWRIIAIGTLKTIAESTLGTDLAEPAKTPVDAFVIPGKAAWSWPLLGDPSANFDTQKEFINYAAEMGWAYCLIDAGWDKQIGYERTKELADYARTKKVRLLLWYNSAGDWNTVKMTPRSKLLTHQDRQNEFNRLKEMGIAGVKIDFFGGDGQAVMKYYRDILDDAAQYGLLVNFHGATLPRGLQRTCPNFMTAEAVKGLEYITFEQKVADQAPSHAAMLPFTRNVFDPMDYTPVVFDKLPRNKKRRTTGAFELALSVIFTSGIQHYAEIPQGMAKVPDYVRAFMKQVPSVWDDIRFIDGYPGKLVVLARKGDGRWLVAGLNGENTGKELTLNLDSIPDINSNGVLITDGDGGQFTQQNITLGADKKLKVSLKPNGGFVAAF